MLLFLEQTHTELHVAMDFIDTSITGITID